MTNATKTAGELTSTRECEYCQAEQAALYRLPLVRPMGDFTGLVVCTFCYIRLAGIKPRRETALTATT